MEAVKKHTSCKWILLYIERWLKAPLQMKDGTLIERNCGSPQGSVISPLISNIFMHHVFDTWMQNDVRNVPFERYADDAIAHCRSEKQAKYLRDLIAKRLARFGLELHPDKTRIVYCKDADRRGSYEHEKFDFLGFEFRPRLSKNKHGKHFVNFTPAVSEKARKEISQEIRSWGIQRRSDKSIGDLALMFNKIVQGWINYYGRFYKSQLYPILRHINHDLFYLGTEEIQKASHRQPSSKELDRAHCAARTKSFRSLAVRCQARWLGNGSRMSREVHVRFCEGLGLKCPGLLTT